MAERNEIQFTTKTWNRCTTNKSNLFLIIYSFPCRSRSLLLTSSLCLPAAVATLSNISHTHTIKISYDPTSNVFRYFYDGIYKSTHAISSFNCIEIFVQTENLVVVIVVVRLTFSPVVLRSRNYHPMVWRWQRRWWWCKFHKLLYIVPKVRRNKTQKNERQCEKMWKWKGSVFGFASIFFLVSGWEQCVCVGVHAVSEPVWISLTCVESECHIRHLAYRIPHIYSMEYYSCFSADSAVVAGVTSGWMAFDLRAIASESMCVCVLCSYWLRTNDFKYQRKWRLIAWKWQYQERTRGRVSSN